MDLLISKIPLTLIAGFLFLSLGFSDPFKDLNIDFLLNETAEPKSTKKIKNTKITHIYSAQSIELGDTVPCNVYHSKIGKKKPTNFYYIPQNSLHHIKIEKLIKKIDSESTKTGEIKITSGKICFHALGKTQNKDSGHIGRQTKFIDSLSKSFKKWNNSFTFAVEKGIYEIFEYDFRYNDDAELKCMDTMFSVKKI